MSKSSGKSKLKRRHHTVPRLLLRRFADGERLIRVPLDGGELRLCGIADVTVHRDFYSMRDASGELDDTVEDLLAELEGKAAKVIRKVINGMWPLPIEDRAIVAEWIAAQHARIPAARAAHNEMADQLGKILIAMGGKPGIRRRLEEDATGPVSDEEVEALWEEMTDFDSYYTEMSVNDHMVSMGQSMKTAYEVFMQRSWGLCRFQRRTLLIPDHPVTLMGDATMPSWRGVGIGNAAAIIMPIDRRAAIIMASPGPDFEFPATTKVAKELNHRLAWNARKELFHHPDDNPLDGIELPPVREREMEISQLPESFLLPDGPASASEEAVAEGPAA
ncbi:DUF4238 domain-containing protein [Streptomyces roseochromogenus]|uniref:DUF4238 domain-containing protein n=1 Tax=Streptomyces roseochromogenus subsp. oscitans DS 12.976 TaxID=1352936 RepID=V6KCS1_STRRC|nr:DUF4238 domain-containing protein [Streptomyces roseochromogenus]EST29892.1 hypothetical protein M878_19250 [Streptomyces roseochromogenus subsp. oscitans DS 12.976]